MIIVIVTIVIVVMIVMIMVTVNTCGASATEQNKQHLDKGQDRRGVAKFKGLRSKHIRRKQNRKQTH